MEINKILLSSLNQLNSLNSEVVKENISTKETSQLNLQDIDEDVELIQKETAETSHTSTDASNSSNNSGRVTFKIMCNNDCNICAAYKDAFENMIEELSNQTSFEYISRGDLVAIARGCLDIEGYYGFPCIVKFVDDEPVEMYDYGKLSTEANTTTGQNTEVKTKNLVNFIEQKLADPLPEKEEKEIEGNVEYVLVNYGNYNEISNALQNVLGDDVSFSTLHDKANETGKKSENLWKQYLYEATGNGPTQSEWTYDKELDQMGFSWLGKPTMVKLVDGKAVAVYTKEELGFSYISSSNISELTEYLKDDYAQTKLDIEAQKNAQKNNLENTSKITENTEQNPNDETADNNQLILKQQLATLKESIQTEYTQIVKEVATDTIKDAIENATSISNLKLVVINNSSDLDFDLQMDLQNTISSLNSDSNLDKAKESLLELLG